MHLADTVTVTRHLSVQKSFFFSLYSLETNIILIKVHHKITYLMQVNKLRRLLKLVILKIKFHIINFK